MRQLSPPCIPYIGMNLTDLTFICDGSSVNNRDTLPNYALVRMYYHIIREIRMYQTGKYSFEVHNKFSSIYSKLSIQSEDILYDTSLLLEPRKKKKVCTF